MALPMPSVTHVLKDEGNNIDYVVLAYRQLTREEVLMSVRVFLSGLKKSKRPKRNSTVEIYSVIGA